MPRVPAVRRDDLDDQTRAVYDAIAATRGPEFARQGPFGVLLHSPVLAGRAAHLGTYVRYEGPMPARHRHLLAMIVARELDCQYEFTAHAVLARQRGIPPEAVAAIGRGDVPSGLPEVETALVAFVRQLVIDHHVDDRTFEALQDHLGLPGLTDVVGAVGYFTFAGHVLNAFEVEVREEQEPEMPRRPAVPRNPA
jgi:4-carboxymuconolactone decarboxylase